MIVRNVSENVSSTELNETDAIVTMIQLLRDDVTQLRAQVGLPHRSFSTEVCRHCLATDFGNRNDQNLKISHNSPLDS